MLVNQRQLSDILGVSTVTLTEWQRAGMPMTEREKNGLENEYETERVVAWMIQRELAKATSQSGRERLDRLRAEREELALRKDLGELVSVELIEPMLDRYVDEVAGVVDGCAEKYALLLQQVIDPEGQHQLLRELAKEIRDALGAFDFAADDTGTPGGGAPFDLDASRAGDAEISPAA
jgi:phage terminase Nu1 subunit (DNA packaging protein)